MRKWICRLALSAAVLGLIAAVVAFLLYRTSQWRPSFYDQSVRIDREKASRAGDEFERNVLAIHNEVIDNRSWQVAISEDQVNGWLATTLPEKFPETLPDSICDPRVQFRERQAELACRYEGPRFSAVASLVVEPFLTEQPNVIALRIRHARIGAFPGLKKKLVEQVSLEARRLRIPLRWTQMDSDPVALVTLDAPETSEWANLQLELLELSAGQLVIRGRSGDESEIRSTKSETSSKHE